MEPIHQLLDEIYRKESRPVFATLIRLLGDFDLAEDAMQDAFRAALEQWSEKGIPSNPRAWLVSAGRFKAIDRIQRQSRFDPLQLDEAGRKNIGAWILGRNMFGPVRGPWPDMNWKGWWGDNPPYHVPVYVLTHHARPPLEMEGGTTFYFVTESIREALAKAQKAANGKDIRIGGGVSTVQQYLREGLIDELHIAIAPAILGSGERLFEGIDLRTSGYECVRFEPGEKAAHLVLRRKAGKL